MRESNPHAFARSSKLRMAAITSIGGIAYILVDNRGIEPLPDGCKPPVLPLSLVAHILLLLNHQHMRSTDQLAIVAGALNEQIIPCVITRSNLDILEMGNPQ